MNLDKKKIQQISGVLVFAVVVGTVAFAGTNSSGKNNKENAKSSDGIVAGATSELTTYIKGDEHSLTAGVTSALISDVASVSSAEGELVSSQEQDAATLCGYTNIGMANIEEGNLNIRDKASAEGEIVGKMTAHNACEIKGEKDGWYEITSGKVSGYVCADYIITGDEAKAIADEEIMTIATVEGTQTLRVRAEANTDSKTRALVGEGEDIIVTEGEDGDDWIKVEVDDQEGYVSSDYVTISKKLPTAKTVTELKYGAGVSDVRVSLVQYALQFVGNRYVWGGTSLKSGVDCSGFTMQIYAAYGIYLPHHSGSQPGYGHKISASEARPGDLFFYGSGSHIGHVGIYIGNGQIVHASNARDGIKISNAYYRSPICVVSYFN